MPPKVPQPQPDQPHAGVDRRRNDMAGRKYSGTTWTAPAVTPVAAPSTRGRGNAVRTKKS